MATSTCKSAIRLWRTASIAISSVSTSQLAILARVFYGSGGYHHQLAANVWNSRGAGRRSHGMAGLDRLEIIVRDGLVADIAARARSAGIELTVSAEGMNLTDPWGTTITLRT